MGLTWTLLTCSIKYVSAQGYGVLLSSSLLERALPWLSGCCFFHSAFIYTTLSLKVTPWSLLWAKIKVESFFQALGKHILVCVARKELAWALQRGCGSARFHGCLFQQENSNQQEGN